MIPSIIRKSVVAAALAAGPVAALTAWVAPSSPSHQAANFACVSVGQIDVGLCLGPPTA